MNRAEFWNDKHATADRFWLADSDPSAVLQLHDLDPRNLRVADIGRGTGRMRKELIAKQNEVVSFDIAELPDTLPMHVMSEQQPFDLGISHLVAQHMNDAELSATLPPMRNGGYTSVQFAELLDEPGPYVRQLMDQGWLYFRTPAEFMRCFEGRSIMWIAAPAHSWKDCGVQWHIARLR